MITVHNVMNTDIPLVFPKDTAQKAAQLLKEKKTKLLVVMERGRVLGILSEETLLREVLLKRKNPASVKVSQLMQTDFHAISPSVSFTEMENLFKGNPRTRLVVMEEGRLVGLITEIDMVAALRDFTRKDYLMQDVILTTFGIITAVFLFYFSPLWTVVFG